jgi:hypothetical protein
VEEIRLGFGLREKRRIRIRLAVYAAAILLLAPVGFSGAFHANPVATVIVLVAVVALGAVRKLEYASEATVVTAEGVVMVIGVRRRTVRWEQITRIEARRRVTLSGTPRMFAYLHLEDTGPIRLPGLVEARFGLSKQDFQDQIGVLLQQWQQQTSRTEAVLVTL